VTGPLLAAALGCLGAGALVDTFGTPRAGWLRTAPYALGAAACALLLVVGVHATVSRTTVLHLGAAFGVGQTDLRLDPLAGLFLTLLFGLGLCVSACCVSWAHAERHAQRRGVGAGFLLLLGSVAVVCCAADAFVFLFAWEGLTVAFYLLTSATRRSDEQASASWATAGIGKVSGASLLVGFLLLSGRAGSYTIAAWHAIPAGGVVDAAWVLVVVGFGAKMGLVPFEVWIPGGYPAAPGPTRAAMAGIAATLGVYGLWRFLGVLAPPPVWLVVLVLSLGGVTALLGIAFAAVQPRLGRVLAYSSIENAGIIVTAYGVALTGVVVHSTPLETIGLLAATLQAVVHAIAKSSLFVSLGFVEASEGSDDLDALRGVGRRLPWSGGAFAAGALALAGMPPTIGFVSEWFVLEALMQQFRLHDLALRLALAGSGALVALTTGLAALTFLRVLGLTFLGPTRRGEGSGREAGLPGKAGLVALGALCLGVAAASPWEFRFIARGLAPVVPRTATLHGLDAPWVLQPVFKGFSILSPSWLWIAMPVAWLGVLGLAVLLSKGRYLRPRRVPAWRSSTAGVDGPSSYSAFGFANPLRHVLANVLGTRRSLELVQTELDGRTTAHIESRTEVVEPVAFYLYRPLLRAALVVANLLRRLQSGRLDAYVAYMLAALVVALAVAAALR
jgi:hydrogenase-4 component B